MIKALRSGRYGVDILAIVAIVSTVIIGQYWATIVIVAMLVGGRSLEEYANERARSELTDLLKRAPKIAHIIESDGSINDRPARVVTVGTMIQVKSGEVVPADAIIVKGRGLVDESSLTGESLPIDKKPGDELLSGSVNGDETLVIRAIRSAKDSQYSQIVLLVKAAGDSHAPFVRLADRYAVPFTLIAFIIGSVAWVLSGDATRFAEVLVVATPCPLLIAAPVALISGMSRAARYGIIIKSGAVLEQLAAVKTVVFDKTGTLTEGKLEVAKVIPFGKTSNNELLRITASAEQDSTHILALTIVAYAKARGIKLTRPSTSDETAGKGLHAKIDNQAIRTGSLNHLADHGVDVSQVVDPQQTAIYVGQDKRYIGMITFADTVRLNSKGTLKRLRALGIDTIAMLTGDNKSTALGIASDIGISDVHAQCLPADKLDAIKTFGNRPVMMVGDGVNDAPVLAAADVGVAMGARGATAASESADVVILLDDISKVANAVGISQHTMRIALQSVMIGIIISIGLMLVAAFGYIPAIAGAGLQEIIDVIVIVNALRAHQTREVR
jgi:heavy metal translocating P-type ATPase